MRGLVIVCCALLVAFTSASPLTLDRKKDDSAPMKVVDVPAGIFDEAETEEQKTVSSKDESPKIDIAASTPVDTKKEVELIGPLADDKPQKGAEGVDDEQGPGIFGFNFRPSIIIFRRPAVMQNPFSGFQSPFFSRRPSIFSPISEEEEKDIEPLSVKEDPQTQNASETKVVNDVITRMQQQMNNLFANLFNPESFFMPRPTFTRPTFSRPSFFGPAPVGDSEEMDNIDFGKLPDNYSNSTSETKVVDGQLVTVNKTVHKIGGNNSNGFFQFSIIKIGPNTPAELPAESTKPEEAVVPVVPAASTNTEISSSESVTSADKKAEMDPQLNEVDRVDEADKESKLPEVELNNKYEIGTENDSDFQQVMKDEDIKIVPIMSAKLIKAPSNGLKTKRIADLSSDIRVNNLMEEAANSGRLRALFDPDEVEVFDV